MEKVRPWCGQPSDRGRLKNRTEQNHRGLLLALPGSLTAIVHASFTLVTVASTTHSNIYTMLAIVAVRRKEKLEWKAVTRGHTDRKLSPMKIDLQIMASR